MMKKVVEKDGKTWDYLLSYLSFAIREVPQSSTGSLHLSCSSSIEEELGRLAAKHRDPRLENKPQSPFDLL